MLYSPSRHEPLVDAVWSDARARDGIAAIVASTEAGYDERTGPWPIHPNDVEPGSDHPLRGVYCGAAGVVWALHRLAADGVVESSRDYRDVADLAEATIDAEPDELELTTQGYLGGRAGALAVALRVGADNGRVDELLEILDGYVDHPANDLFYGAPGTMVVAAAEHERTGDERFADVWRRSADELLARWSPDDELGVRTWTQQFLPDRSDRYLGIGHGFAGNVLALLLGPGLDPDERLAVEREAVATAKRLAVVEHDGANWPALVGGELELKDGIRTQWCHGAPGMVIALARACTADDEWTELLLAGGRTTWAAGPIRDRAGLCHGTAGNAYAFLALWQRTGDELWLERARSFALHALAQVERETTAWHSLFTGDPGVALCLASCLSGDARFPGLDLL